MHPHLMAPAAWQLWLLSTVCSGRRHVASAQEGGREEGREREREREGGRYESLFLPLTLPPPFSLSSVVLCAFLWRCVPSFYHIVIAVLTKRTKIMLEKCVSNMFFIFSFTKSILFQVLRIF